MIPENAHDRALLERARHLTPHLTLDHLDDQTLLQICREHGHDVATALVYQRACAAPRHASLAARLQSLAPIPSTSNLIVGVVPGAFYDRHPHTGADGERVIAIGRTQGLAVERIQTLPFADSTTNGRLIAAWIHSHAAAGRRVALVTLSKGTMDARAATQMIDAHAAQSIAGWLSLSGLWNGTALVDWLDRRPFRKLLIRGVMAVSRRPFATVATLRRSHSPVIIPRLGGRVISVVGMPLRTHLAHRWAPASHDKLSEFGPNDGGGITLSDIRHAPGELFPLWGVDHYLNPSWDVSPLISRLLLETLRPIERDAPDNHPAMTPAITPTAPPATRSIT